MKIDEARDLLARGGFEITSETRLANDTGTQMRLSNDAIVNVFDKGTYNVLGKNIESVQAALGVATPADAVPAAHASPKKKVFVVYGHDQPSRDQLEAMLRRWGLEPLILDQLPTESESHAGGVPLVRPAGRAFPSRATNRRSWVRASRQVLAVLPTGPLPSAGIGQVPTPNAGQSPEVAPMATRAVMRRERLTVPHGVQHAEAPR